MNYFKMESNLDQSRKSLNCLISVNLPWNCYKFNDESCKESCIIKPDF